MQDVYKGGRTNEAYDHYNWKTVRKQRKKVGELLAERLSLPLYGKAELQKIAEGTDDYEEVQAFYEEEPVNSLLYAIAMSQFEQEVGRIPFRRIRELASKESCIIIGRCAGHIFREDPEAVRVFIHADPKIRVQRIMEREGLSETKAKKFLEDTDSRRASFHKYYTKQEWGLAQDYELCLDSGVLGIEGTVEVLTEYLRFRGFFKGMNEKTYERVIEYLKQQIQEGKLSCGSKIPSERELAASLNLGRNSVREALRTMEHTGMLESRQGKGNFLVNMPQKSLGNVFSMMLLTGQSNYREVSRIRRILEQEAFVQAVRLKNPEVLKRLKAEIKEMQIPEKTAEHDRRFHQELIRAGENQLLVAVMESLSGLCEEEIAHVQKEAKMRTGVRSMKKS